MPICDNNKRTYIFEVMDPSTNFLVYVVVDDYLRKHNYPFQNIPLFQYSYMYILLPVRLLRQLAKKVK